MGFLKDALSMFKKRDLPLIESYRESDDVYTFLFRKPQDVTWEAGQHGLITITHKKIKNNTRPYTVASIPEENVIQITTRISENPSDFKKAMLELKEGMQVRMAGPIGSFSLKDNQPTLLIAGGIGITPFRAILKQLESVGTNGEKQINLLYLDSGKTYLFKDDLDSVANNASINVTYLDSREDLHKEIDKFTTLYKQNGNYLIAGPKSMVDAISAYLQNKNVPKRNIKKDAFYGY